MTQRHFITAKKYDELLEEVKRIETVELPAVAQEIDIARSHGDLRENAQYAAAREKQRMIESKLQDIQNALTTHTVIDISSQKFDAVAFGAKVKIKFFDDNSSKIFTILSDYESDISRGIMSINAPIIQAIIGLKVDDTADITIAGKTREVAIESIEPCDL